MDNKPKYTESAEMIYSLSWKIKREMKIEMGEMKADGCI